MVPEEKVSAVMFCKQFSAYAVHNDYHSIHKHQAGLNMHLYDDIGDASSSLRGSTSSLNLLLGGRICVELHSRASTLKV